MEIKRFFIPKENLIDNSVLINGAEAYHLIKVLRCKVGYKIIVCDGSGKDFLCKIEKVEEDSIKATVLEVFENKTEIACSLTLFQALPKGDKLDLITQKTVELGVNEIIPFTSKYTNETKFNKERLERIALEASKQCGRARKCEVGKLITFDQVLDILPKFDEVIFLYEKAENGYIKDIVNLQDNKSIALIVGSEGGFSEEEAETLKKRDVKTVTLGRRILRCETAAIVSIALVVDALGGLTR